MAFGYAVYFAEAERDRVIRWDPDLGVADVVAGEPPVADPSQKLWKPYGLAWDASGDLVIADKFHNRIVRLKNGRLEPVVLRDVNGHRNPRPDSHAGYKPRPPRTPTGLFAETGGAILAACFNDGTVYRIFPDGRLELVLGITPSRSYHIGQVREVIPPGEVGDTPIYRPLGAVKRSDGTIFLIERGYQVVREFHPGRGLRSIFPLSRQREWMERTSVPNEVAATAYHPSCPAALALDAKENLYIAELGHRCVLAVDFAAGKVRRVVESRAKPSPPPTGISALAFGPDGTAWVMDSGAGVVEAYRPEPQGPWTPLGISLSKIRGEPLMFPAGSAQILTGR